MSQSIGIPQIIQPGTSTGWGVGGTGTVTTVSVVSANGLAGIVSNPTTTPAITLSTSISGVLKGNGTSISSAVAGTDYEAPITAGTSLQYYRGDKTMQTLNGDAVANTPAGNVSSTNVQNAINELDTIKLNVSALSSNIILYPTTASSDIGGYYKMVTSTADPSYDVTAVDVTTGAISTSDQLVSSLATTSNIIAGNPGIINIVTVGNIQRTGWGWQATFYFQLYRRESGGTEHLICTSNTTDPVDTSAYAEFTATALLNDGTWASTDRIVIKYYASKIVWSGSNPTYNFQFGGGSPVRTLLPVPVSVIPTNFNLTGAVTSVGTTTSLGSFTTAQLNTALSDNDIATGGGTATGTNTGDETTSTIKTKLGITTLSWSNTWDQTSIVGITGTIAQFNTACTDADFATGWGTATGTNTGDQTSIVGITGTKAQFNTAVSDWDIVYSGDALGTPSSGTLSSCTVDGTNKVGYLNIPQNSQSAAYTTVLADAGKHIYHPSADTTARTITIDSNANVAYPIGTALTFVNDTSAGTLTISITSDTLVLAGAGTTGSRTLAANGVATAIKVTSTRWIISWVGLS